MNKNEFIKKLTRIKSATSVTGKTYSSIYVYGDRIEFVREHKSRSESISISELFELFANESSITTAVAKSYISGGVQSPAVAILNQLKIIPSAERIFGSSRNINNSPNKKEQKTNSKLKDETKFFIAFSEIVSIDYIQSKSVGKPINSSHIFLSNNYVDFAFNQEINNCYAGILTDLKSNYLFNSESLSYYVDGIIINHPILKTRIVEFDEEQHFTPARKDTLRYLSNILPDYFLSKINEICNDKEYLNKCVLKKHRIKNRLETIPKTFIEFVKWLEQSNEKPSGYICGKNGFKFLGGRIAQRAYYDCLRDTAHLSERNSDFDNPLRFAKKKCEDIERIDFGLISKYRIKRIIIEILKNDYKITLPNA